VARAKFPFFPWYASETEADGDWVMMDLAERGLFITLLDYGWINDGLPFDTEALARIARVDIDTFKRLWKRVGLKFTADHGKFINRRQETERLRVNEKSVKAASAAAQRWNNGNDVDANAYANASPEHCEGNARASKSKSKSSSSGFSEKENLEARSKPKVEIALTTEAEFEELFWPILWRKVGKGACLEAYKKARRKHTAEKLRSAAITQGPALKETANRGSREALHPATWLNQGRFDDEDFALLPPNVRPNGVRKSASSESADRVTKMIEEEYEAEQAEQKRSKSAN
jgi:uncharacterized protein YdaU (DUF1376 family)